MKILLAVALVSAFFGLLELFEGGSQSVWHWGSELIHSILKMFSHGGKGHSSSPPTTSRSIAEEVVNEAKHIITGGASSGDNSKAGLSTMPHKIGMKAVTKAMVEPIVITAILLINAMVGGYQSLNASKGISALKEMQAQNAVVRINSDKLSHAAVKEVEVEASSLVPGDVVVLAVGQKIPADIRLISIATSTFTVDEASLTGESDSVPKMPYRGDASTSLHASGMLYGGTVITAGKGIGVVVRTGMDTEMGKVS